LKDLSTDFSLGLSTAMHEPKLGEEWLRELKQGSPFITLASVVITAVLLGLAVNYLAAILFRLWEDQLSLGQQAVLAGLVTIGLMLLLAGLYVTTRPPSTMRRQIEILIPYVVQTERVEVGQLPRYHPSYLVREALSKAFSTDATGTSRFQSAWRAGKGEQGRPIWGFALDCTYDLIEYLCLHHLGRYGRRTVGTGAKWTAGTDLIPGLKRRGLQFAQFPDPLTLNYMMNHDRQFMKRMFDLPAEMVFEARCLPRLGFVAENQGQEVSQLVFRAKFGPLLIGELAITPSQIWRQVRKRRRTGRIIQKVLPEGPRTEVHAILIPLELKASFNPWFVHGPRFEACFLWLMGFYEYLAQRLDWNRYLETDLRRMVVELHDKLV
jgi:hypothetical protein